jgi:hypothetical protein
MINLETGGGWGVDADSDGYVDAEAARAGCGHGWGYGVSDGSEYDRTNPQQLKVAREGIDANQQKDSEEPNNETYYVLWMRGGFVPQIEVTDRHCKEGHSRDQQSG